MLKCILPIALLLACQGRLTAQYSFCEADWFAFRLKWANQFETIEPVNDRFAVVWRNGRCGISDRDGKLIVPVQYQERASWKPILRDEQRFAIVRDDGTVLEISGYDNIQPHSENLWQVTLHGLTGLMDDSLQRWVLPPRFKGIGGSKRWYVQDSSGRRGEIDSLGHWIHPAGVVQLSHGLFFRMDEAWHFQLTDSAGMALLDCWFENVVPMCDGSFWADRWGNSPLGYSMDKRYFQHYSGKGQLLSDPVCERIYRVDDNAMKVLRNDQYLWWDSCGNILIPGASWDPGEQNYYAYESPDHEPFLPFDMVRFKKDRLFGLYLTRNKKIIAPQYRRIYAAPGKIIASRTSGGTDWYDREGNLLKTTTDSITGLPDPSWRLFLTTNADGWMGVIDADGKTLILPQFKFLKFAGSGCYTFRDNDRQERLLDPFGIKIPLPGDHHFERICGNYILIRKMLAWGLADLSGQVVIEPQFESLVPMKDNYLFQYKGANGLYGIVDATGRMVLPAEYEQGDIELNHGYLFLRKNGLYGISDRAGRLIHPFEYTGKNWLGSKTVLTKSGETFVFYPNSGILLPAGLK